MGWLDGIMLAVLALSMAVGIFRGLVFELLSMLAWVAAWFVARQAGAVAGSKLPLPIHDPAISAAVGFAVVFVAVLFIVRLLTSLVRQVIHASPLGSIDHWLGAMFGLTRGVAIVLALVTLLAMTPMSRQDLWRASVGVRWAQQLGHFLSPLLPSDPLHTKSAQAGGRRVDQVS